MRIIIWFHRDLRTHDHLGLQWALSHGSKIMAVAFRPRSDSSEAKLKFWQQTANDLAASLKAANITFTVSDQDPKAEIPRIVNSNQIDKVVTHRRMNWRDQTQIDELAAALPTRIMQMGDLTLFNSDHALELTIKQLQPFTRFKNHALAHWKVPDALERPEKLKLIPPSISEWSAGGENSGLRRLQDYLWGSKACLHYHETRNGMIKTDDSSKFSRWLAWGALSPRYIYQELKKLEDQVGPSEGIAALIYELIWRDYFKFLAFVMKDAFFSRQGLRSSPIQFEQDENLFERWTTGQTGEEFVDANMRELLITGWMSNRGRQNVASFLAKTLKLDWTLGADWFEKQLIDDDPENNWGNWQYLAGVGTDPRDRKFDVQRQAAIYDPAGEYRAKWVR